MTSKTFTIPVNSTVNCQVCGSDGLCNDFEDNGQVESCPTDHACYYVSESIYERFWVDYFYLTRALNFQRSMDLALKPNTLGIAVLT